MKAAQLVAPKRFEIVDVPAPNLAPQSLGAIIVKVELAGICGSDIPTFAYEHPPTEYPFPPGLSAHECIGVISASRSPRLKEGDPVIAIPEESNGLAEYFLTTEGRTVPLLTVPQKEQLLLSQPLGTVLWACRKLPNILLKDIVVMGQGPMGLLMTHVLSNLGAKTVVALDKLDYRLLVSKQMHATHTVNVDKEDAIELVREVTEGRMADLVVEIVGHQQETLNQCLHLVKRGGTILAFGVPDDEVYRFDFGRFYRQNLTLIGSVGPEMQNDIPLAMDMIVQGRVNVSPIISHKLPFDRVQRGFEIFTRRTDGAIKVVLNYDGM